MKVSDEQVSWKKDLEARIAGVASGAVDADRMRQENDLYRGVVLIPGGTLYDPPAAERFRMLRAHIERANMGERNCRLLSVVSSVPGEGKSLVATNLSCALSIDPQGRTLLIDCDLRKPTVHDFFQFDRGPGLADALVSRQHLGSVIRPVSRGLDVITAGNPINDPALAIELPILQRQIFELRDYYRYIVIDCPPVLLCPEPITISNFTDATLMVVRGWHTERRLVNDAIEAIGRERILGLIMNDGMDSSQQYRYYRYYGTVDQARGRRAKEIAELHAAEQENQSGSASGGALFGRLKDKLSQKLSGKSQDYDSEDFNE